MGLIKERPNNNEIYFSNYSDNRKLYKVNIDSKEVFKIVDDYVSCINIVSDSIYFKSESDFEVYRCGLEGSKLTKLQ